MNLFYGGYLRSCRLTAGKTLSDVSKALGVSISYLSDIERDQRGPMSWAKITQLAELLDADIGILRALAVKKQMKIQVMDKHQFEQLCKALSE